jgi:serine phosphatase RsbU (regulator of sigma subunit)
MVTSSDILNAKILVVDDKEANVRLLEGMLRVAGYTSVDSTTDPTEVYELHRKNRYGLILLDLQMPGLDGFQVMESLHTIEADDYLPVLVITAQPDHKLRALAAGAKDFVSKPFELAELRARVRNILEVRLLHLASKRHSKALEETVRELEASREVIRLKTLEEQKKSEQELTLAQETQESLLPRVVPQFENFKIQAFNNPTRYVGGDFYDFQRIPADPIPEDLRTTERSDGVNDSSFTDSSFNDPKVVVMEHTAPSSNEWMGVLADVSGKGMPAAILSSMLLGALSTEVRSGTRLPEALNRVNRLLCEKSLPFQFATLFLFMLRADGAGEFISAGHNPAYLFRSATGKIERLVSDLYPLGMFDFAAYQSSPLHLCGGDILLVYSDGLTDAENQRHEMFGETRLLDLIRHDGRSGSPGLVQKLLQALEEFTQGTPQTDDITFVVVEKSYGDRNG